MYVDGIYICTLLSLSYFKDANIVRIVRNTINGIRCKQYGGRSDIHKVLTICFEVFKSRKWRNVIIVKSTALISPNISRK